MGEDRICLICGRPVSDDIHNTQPAATVAMGHPAFLQGEP